ncbi:MAG: hexose kinase [Betaproteobacteria bacterium]|nr:hexose kinase [Betaproteobacteria bacterium]
MARFVTVTPNPALDLTLEVERLHVGGVNVASLSRFDSGGKGANVARMLAQLGGDVTAVVALPSDGGGSWITGFPRTIDLRTTRVNATLRANVAITSEDGVTTKVNMRGGPINQSEGEALLNAIAGAARGGAWVIVGGSLPTGMDATWIRRAVEVSHASGARIAVDCSGEALRVAVESGADLVKPNGEEAAAVVGFDVVDQTSAGRAALELTNLGAKSVLLSLGEHGAVYLEKGGRVPVQTGARKAVVRSTVGAGDVLLASFLYALTEGADPTAALRSAVAWAAAKVQQPGTAMPTEPLTD